MLFYIILSPLVCTIILHKQQGKQIWVTPSGNLHLTAPKTLLSALETNYSQWREIAHYGLSVYSLTFDPFECVSPAVSRWMAVGWAYQEVMRYWAKLMLTGVPVMVTWRSLVPSSWLPILIWAPDTCLISLILVPWRPMIEPINCGGAGAKRVSLFGWKWIIAHARTTAAAARGKRPIIP